MNNDLLINMYKLLKHYIKQNEEDLVTYNNMVENGDTYEERAEFCNKMKPAVDNFYSLKPYYIKYKENPTQELEIEILKKFGALIDEFKLSGKGDKPATDGSKSKELLEELARKAAENDAAEKLGSGKTGKKPFPQLDGSNQSDFISKLNDTANEKNGAAQKRLEETRAEAEKPGKKEFPKLNGDNKSKEYLEELARKAAENEAADKEFLEDISGLNFSGFDKKRKSGKPRVRPFLEKLSGLGKDFVEAFKEGFASSKEKNAERRKAANVYYYPEESEHESSGSLALGK